MGDIISGLAELAEPPAIDDWLVLTDKSDISQAGTGTTKKNKPQYGLGSQVNPQTGTTYTYLTTDFRKLVTHTNGSSIAGTLPQAGASFPAGWFVLVQNRGAGVLTITPTTSTIDGAATFVLNQNEGAIVVSDGTNYFTLRGKATGAAGVGDVVGPGSSTDNALARFDTTTGKLIQNSTVTIDDNGAITVPEIAAPSTPAAGKVVIYAKSDNKVYRKGEDGTEAELGGGGGGTNPTSGTLPYNDTGTFADSPIARLDAATVRAEVFHGAGTSDVNTNGVISGRGTGVVVGRDLQFGLQNGSGTLDALFSKPTRHTGLLSVRRDTSGNGATFAYPPDSPAQITANQNDYSLGTNRSKYIRLTSNGVWDITGFTLPSDGLGNTQAPGQEHVLVYVGANSIILKHQSASSSAANRILCSTGADITLGPEQAADMFYDDTTQRWRVYKRN